MTGSRRESREIGLSYAMSVLKARGYNVTRDSSRDTPDLYVISPRGTKFWVNCRNVEKKGFTWIISKTHDDYKPYFILVYGPTASNTDPVEFWILSHDEILEFIRKYDGVEPQGNDDTFKDHLEQWHKLPR